MNRDDDQLRDVEAVARRAGTQQDVKLYFWTIPMAAAHYGITTATVRKYIREGLPVYFANDAPVVRSREFIDEYLKRRNKQLATRMETLPRNPG